MSDMPSGAINLLDEASYRQLEHSYLTFWLDEQLYGLSIANVIQIIGMQPITKIPDFPSYAKGIITLRGQVLPIIDLRMRLGRLEGSVTDRTCILVMEVLEDSFGVVVDRIEEVLAITDEMRVQPPQMDSKKEQMLLGIANTPKGVTLLIDARQLMSGERLSVPQD